MASISTKASGGGGIELRKGRLVDIEWMDKIHGVRINCMLTRGTSCKMILMPALLLGVALLGGCGRPTLRSDNSLGKPQASREQTVADYAGTYTGTHPDPSVSVDCKIDATGKGVLRQTLRHSGGYVEDEFQLSSEGAASLYEDRLRFHADGQRLVVQGVGDKGETLILKKVR